MLRQSIALVALLGAYGSAQGALIDLTGEGFVQYGDAQSYSLPISGINVPSSPGQIADLVVIATGTNNVPTNTNFAGMDNAYRTPDGQSGGNFFSTGTEADPGQVSNFTGDQSGTWDSSLRALKTFLNDEQMIFLFNNNNLNGANEQSLAAWFQITVTDNNGNLVNTLPGLGSTTNTAIFDLTNNGGAYDLVSEGGGGTFFGDVTTYSSDGSGPDGNTNASTDYVLSGGPICVDNDAGPIPVPVSCGNPDADDLFNHNLGADNAAYAVFLPELNALLDSLFTNLTDQMLDDYTMHVDLRLGCDPNLFGADPGAESCTGAISGFGKNINNGYEQLFIATATFDRPPPPPGVPLPGTALLIGAALMGWRLSRG